MKSLFKASILLGVVMASFLGCSSSSPANPSPTPSPSQIPTAGLTVLPGQTPTATIEPTPTEGYVPPVRPTSIPILDPALVPGLLSKAFSVKALESLNGHSLQVITGWQYGLQFQWLDSIHLLLYPRIGQERNPFTGRLDDIVPQLAVINFESGHVWLPKPREYAVHWSRELGILITTGPAGSATSGEKEATFIYTPEGEWINQYWGKLLSISPSGTKILIEDDTLVDLRNNRIADLNWYIDYSRGETSRIYWSTDERHIYKCCFYYGDTETGKSYSFELSDFQGFEGGESPYIHSSGRWVRNNNYFLVVWGWVDDGDQRYMPMFDPINKIYYDVRKRAAIPPDSGCPNTYVSPDGIHVWLECWEGSYLINLETFNSAAYSNHIVGGEIEWSTNGKFALVKTFDPDLWQILSVSNQELKPLPVNPSLNTDLWWHPADAVIVYPSTDNKLIFLDATTILYQELPFALLKPPSVYDNVTNVIWGPDGEKLALIAEDGSVWQAGYPKLENLEQLTPPLPDVHDVKWSPDGNSIAFISGSDIYIVDTTKK